MNWTLAVLGVLAAFFLGLLPSDFLGDLFAQFGIDVSAFYAGLPLAISTRFGRAAFARGDDDDDDDDDDYDDEEEDDDE